jgi:hypothetical protein
MMEMREGARERLNWVHKCLVGDGHLRMTGLPSWCGSVGYSLEFTMSFRTETLLGQVQVKSTAGGLFDEMSYLAKKRKKKRRRER